MNPPPDIPQTEENIPLLADLAVRRAYKEALEAGQSVLTVRDEMLVEVFPDGRVRDIRPIAPGISVEPGQSASLR